MNGKETTSLARWCKENDKTYLLDEWDYKKNNEIPDNIGFGSEKKVWWICENGHNFESMVYVRKNGGKCPYCSNQKVLYGYNDLETWCKKNNKTYLLEEWDYQNNTILPKDITYGSSKEVNWMVPYDDPATGKHFELSWSSRLSHRTKDGLGCPYLSNKGSKALLVGFNDLQTKCPDLAKEWHPTKNGELTPDQVIYGSKKKVWWLKKVNDPITNEVCELEWEASIETRSIRGLGSPFDTNLKIYAGYNDFESWCRKNSRMDLLQEWDDDNNNISPKEISNASSKKIWWKCDKGHRWEATISSRVLHKSGCRKCNCGKMTSFPEQAIFYYVSLLFNDAENGNRSILNGRELDIYIPSLNVGIEYDGSNWHQNIQRDFEKNKLCNEKGIYLIRIRENSTESEAKESIRFLDKADYFIHKKGDEDNLADVIKDILAKLKSNNSINIDLARDTSVIQENYMFLEAGRSFASIHPEMVDEWDYVKNGNMLPENFSYASNIKVWWKCDKGHSYRVSINDRHSGSGCPFCAGKRTLKGFNDLASANAELLVFWNFEKNEQGPQNYTSHSNKKVWWKCSEGHSFLKTINNFASHPTCPICSNDICLPGYNDIATKNVELLLDWDFEKNSERPSEVCFASTKYVFWKCHICNQEWKTTIRQRTLKHTKCPHCANRTARKVQCIETGEVYSSVNAVKRKLNISSAGSVAQACSNPNRTLGGYHWKYLENS